MASGVDAGFEAIMRSRIDNLNGSGEITGTETTRARRFGILGATFDEMFERNGEPLSDSERRDEGERRQQFEGEVRGRIAAGLPPQPDSDEGVRFDRYLMDRYETAIVGEEDVRGHRCWVLSMRPREGKLPEHNRMDKVLNRASGRLWVAQDDFGVARVEFILNEPIKYLGGLLAKVRKADGRLELARVEPGVWLLSSFEIQLDIRIVFKSIRRLISNQWSDYRRVD